MTPKAALTVKGDLASAGLITFKKKVADTTFSFQISDHTLRDLGNYSGYTVSAQRTDGGLKTTLSHDFGKNAPKLRLEGSRKVGGATYGLDYTHLSSGPSSVVGTANVGKGHKVALGHKLESGLSQVTYTLDKGDYAGSAAIDTNKATGLTATRREGGRSLKLGLHSAGPKHHVALEWVAKPFKVAMSAPVSRDGLGTATTSLIWEKTYTL